MPAGKSPLSPKDPSISWLDLADYKRGRKTSSLWTAFRKVFGLFARLTLGWRIRTSLLRLMGVDIGHCYVGHDCLFDDEVPELISVSDGVVISSRVTMMAHDSGRNRAASIRIEPEVFIGVGAIILPGVVVGQGAVVGAGAVVSKAVEAGTIVVGVPARPIGHPGAEPPSDQGSRTNTTERNE